MVRQKKRTSEEEARIKQGQADIKAIEKARARREELTGREAATFSKMEEEEIRKGVFEKQALQAEQERQEKIQLEAEKEIQAEQQIQPQQEIQPKEELTLPQKISKVALTPAVAIGNVITAGLEKVTGKSFDRTTAEELARTTEGQILGLATAGVAVAAAGTFAYTSYLGSLSAQQLINLGTSRAIPVAMRIPATSAFTKITSGKILSGLFVTGGISTTFRILRKDAKNAIIALDQEIADVLEDVEKRDLSYSQARQQLSQIEADINRLRGSVKLWGTFDFSYWLGGGQDDMQDVENSIRSLEQARFDVINIAREAAVKRLQLQ